MDTSPISSVPVGYDTNWGFWAWVTALGLLFVALLLAGAAAMFLYAARTERDYLGDEDSGLMMMSGGCYLVALSGSAILVWNIARHLPIWGWTLVFYGIFIAAVAFFSMGMIGLWQEHLEVRDDVWGDGRGRALAHSAGLPILVAVGVAFAAFVGDSAARSGIMREVPERIATGAGLVLYVAIAFVLVPFGTKMYLKANS